MSKPSFAAYWRRYLFERDKYRLHTEEAVARRAYIQGVHDGMIYSRSRPGATDQPDQPEQKNDADPTKAG